MSPSSESREPDAGSGPSAALCSDADKSDPPSSSIEAVPSTVNGHKPPRLLLVDDDPSLLVATSRQLRGAGYVVVEASNGADALELVSKESFDIILSDIGMPELDGIDLLREVQHHDPYVPVVLITGAPDV